MFVNYFKIAFRYLLKNRTFSLVNLFGLTLGFLCFILIAVFIQDELSFDQFHKDSERIYRVIQHETKDDGTIRSAVPVSAKIGPEALAQLPEVEDVTRYSSLGRITVGNDPANRGYERLNTPDANFFKFFNFTLVEGDPATLLDKPNSIVINETLAKKYFGNGPAVGQTLWSSLSVGEERNDLVITGVMKNAPKNSHLQPDILFSEPTWPAIFPWYNNFMSTDWSSNSFLTYIKLKPNVDVKAFESKLTQLVKTNYPQDKPFKSAFTLQPLKDIHLFSENLQGAQGSLDGIKPFYLYMFAAVAGLILLIACLNYMNLSTAAAYKRTREIGTRKTLGAQKSQLILQFTGEALILSILSLVVAVALAQVLLPIVNNFLEKELSLSALPRTWMLSLVASMIGAGLLSSLYPSFIIARVVPAEAIKRDVRIGSRSVPLRKMLVVAQFTVSIMMIASTLVIYRQLNFMKEKDLGFNLENLLVVDINSDPLRRNFENVKAQFKSVPEVQAISTSTRVPGEWKTFPIASVKNQGASEQSEMIFVGIDKDFLSTYNIKLLAGRNFEDSKADSTKVILTKLAVKALNLEDPIGKVIEVPGVRWGGSVNNLEQPFRVEVIGVADDFYFESFRAEMMPLIFGAANTVIQRIDYYTLRVKTDNWEQTIAKLKEVNTKLTADDPLEYTFLDGRFQEFYKADTRRGQVFLAFSFVIILIACLGLFALVSYTIEGRTKEIGIRKVLGASVQNIVQMISKEFLILILIAGVIAIPIAYYLMNAWLQDFAYHIALGADIFILSSVIAIVIALTTIGVRAIRAAIVNPVKSLRSE